MLLGFSRTEGRARLSRARRAVIRGDEATIASDARRGGDTDALPCRRWEEKTSNNRTWIDAMNAQPEGERTALSAGSKMGVRADKAVRSPGERS